MTTGDFDPFPQSGESREQYEQRFTEAMLAEDWKLCFQANGASFRALGDALTDETDPNKVIALTEQRGESLIRSLGSGAISLWKDDILAEREQFEADFGSTE